MSVSVHEARDGFRVRQPEQDPARLAVRGESDFAGHGEASPAEGLAERAPSGREVLGKVSDALLREDCDSVGVGTVARLGLEYEPVLTDLGAVA